MIDKIQAFGDSFTDGTDLKSVYLSWPALISRELGLKYECHANGGCGNLSIAGQVLENAQPNGLSIINWTWPARLDYIWWDGENNDSHTVNCIRPNESNTVNDFYFRNIQHEATDKIRTFSLMLAVNERLRTKKIASVQTYLDHEMMEDHWSPSVTVLQSLVRDHLTDFRFHQWARENNYPLSITDHPLEQAHEEAAKIMLPVVEKAINTYIK